MIGGTSLDTSTYRWTVDNTANSLSEFTIFSWGAPYRSFEIKDIELPIDSGWKKYLAQWVLREKPYTPKCKIKSIVQHKPEPVRRILRCNRKGIGLRMRKSTQ